MCVLDLFSGNKEFCRCSFFFVVVFNCCKYIVDVFFIEIFVSDVFWEVYYIVYGIVVDFCYCNDINFYEFFLIELIYVIGVF